MVVSSRSWFTFSKSSSSSSSTVVPVRAFNGLETVIYHNEDENEPIVIGSILTIRDLLKKEEVWSGVSKVVDEKNDADLQDLIGNLMSKRIMGDRPLWCVHSIDVLKVKNPHTVLLWRFHHSQADGQAMMRCFHKIFGSEITTPSPQYGIPRRLLHHAVSNTTAPHPSSKSSISNLVMFTCLWIHGAWLSFSNLIAFLLVARKEIGEFKPLRPGRQVAWSHDVDETSSANDDHESSNNAAKVDIKASTTTSKSMTKETEFGVGDGKRKVNQNQGRVSLEEVAKVKRALGVSLNDVVLTCMMRAIRWWIAVHCDENGPRDKDLRIMMPTSHRPPSSLDIKSEADCELISLPLLSPDTYYIYTNKSQQTTRSSSSTPSTSPSKSSKYTKRPITPETKSNLRQRTNKSKSSSSSSKNTVSENGMVPSVTDSMDMDLDLYNVDEVKVECYESLWI
ncbi:hypothetical protein HDU76_005123 [Blyttiomyces sp. JEL0837]|nr:hypothetical protein HDU76_005123 [Blyttiomyces sp. JEL0837]